MRARLQVSGGAGYFPGLAAPRMLDVDTLEPEESRAVKALIDDARFFELSSRIPAPRGAADNRTYEVTIEDGGRHHTVVVSEPIGDPALQALVNRLSALTARRR